MSRLAPGRKTDMHMLLTRRAKAQKYSQTYDQIQRKIDHLIEEGKHPAIHSLRWRLIGAQTAKDQTEIEKIAKQIEQYSYRKGWLKRWL